MILDIYGGIAHFKISNSYTYIILFLTNYFLKAAAKKKPAPPPPSKKKAKAPARDNSTESESIKSESESEDEEVTIKKPTPAAKNQKSANSTASKKTPAKSSSASTQNKNKKSVVEPKPSLMSSDSESGILITPTRATRRQTRGGNGPKKSKHILSSTSKYFLLLNSLFKFSEVKI